MTSLEQAAAHLAASDPVLAPIIATSPLPSFEAHTNYYQALVKSIIGQQLSVKAAATISKRFSDLFDEPIPQPQHILEKDIEELRNVGLSRPKAGYIQDLAQRVLDGTVRFELFDKLPNDEIIRELTEVKGIGEWTVHMFLMFCMARLDVLPVGDLGIRNGIQRLYQLDHLPTPDDIRIIASKNKWYPYESAASWYVWRSLHNKSEVSP